jgi:uncharacterized integral membrane protein
VAQIDEAGPRRDRTRDVRMVVIGVIAVLFIWFAVANTQEVEVHFWVDSARAPVIVVIVIAGLLGVVVGVLLDRRRSRR